MGFISTYPAGPPAMRILGTGRYMPKRRLSSAEVDRNLGWPVGTTARRYGLDSRAIAEGDETSSAMGAEAAKAALRMAGIAATELDLILGACGVMEQPIPSTATLVQSKLGLGTSGIPAYDVNATCLSFVQALELAALKIAAGQVRRVLVFSADIASAGLDWSQPDAAAIFGDGAAAVVLGADQGQGLLASRMETYSEASAVCRLEAGGTRINLSTDPARLREAAMFRMDGRAAFRHSARHLPGFLARLMKEAGAEAEDLACIVPHQASGAALEHGLARLGLPSEKVIRIFRDSGNQIATSIPSALHEAIVSGRLHRGQLALLIGTSAGISLGGMVLRY